MKRFALIGAAGYIAPRHMRAIKETGNDLVVAMDPVDSVGVIDRYFPRADFFKEFERFERNVNKRRYLSQALDYVAICSPNYMHDSHIRFALRNDIDAICEKPLVLNPWTMESLIDAEKESGRRIYTILQLRNHPAIEALKTQVEKAPDDKIYDIDLTYITSRGTWYYTTWKANEDKGGGIATNIGVHFFDMLCWIFGQVKHNEVHLYERDKAAGFIEFQRARVRWFLSINSEMLPEQARKNGLKTYRNISIDGQELEFSDGFTDLHTRVYEQILANRGYRVIDAKAAIDIVFMLRHMSVIGINDNSHPLTHQAIKRPFTGFSQDLVSKYMKHYESSMCTEKQSASMPEMDLEGGL
ncbi:MAG: Gfo/Idh/MocA family oxidoreductase [Francisellaceae bacterium]